MDKADVITDTASGSIASFTDGADDLPLKSLVVDIDPIQDLHGQDAPYPAGGGKNLWNEEWELGVWDAAGAKVNSDTAIRSKGYISVSSETTYYLYIGARYTVGLIIRVLDSNKNFVSTITVSNSMAFTIPAGGAFIVFCTYASNNITVYDNDIAINYPSTVTTYSPYENICPISGWTSVDVEHSGVNLFDKAKAETGYIDDNSGVLKAMGAGQNSKSTDYIMVKPNTPYRIVSEQTKGSWGAWYDGDKNYISGITGYIASASEAQKTKLSPSNARYMRLTAEYYVDGAVNGNVNTFSVNYPSTDHDYHPYTGRSITIDLGQTVYGGHLDVVSGVLTVDRAINVIDGTQSLALNGIQTYGGAQVRFTPSPTKALADSSATQNGGLLSDKFSTSSPYTNVEYQLTGRATNANVYFNMPATVTTAEQARTWFASNPTQLAYKLAEPIEIQLSANQINSIYGVNNIWADSGDTTCVYRADTKKFIERKISEALASLT